MILDTLSNIDATRGLRAIPDDTIDVIFTDPPYVKETWEEAYRTLAEAAPRILKPSGYLITYAPQMNLQGIMEILGGSLSYFWLVAQRNAGNKNCIIFSRKAMAMWKPILIYQKPPVQAPPRAFCDMVSGRKMKRYHMWGQSINETLALLSRFATPGAVVLDPYVGGGTNTLAAKLLGMHWIGMEIDPAAHAVALERMDQSPLDLWGWDLV